MYIRFVDSQTNNNEEAPTPNKNIYSLIEIVHEYANPTLMEKETDAFENAVIEKFSPESTHEERQRGFQGLMSFAGTLPEDFDYKKRVRGGEE